MSNKKRRRKWTAAQKLRIVLETLQSDGKVAQICRREGISPNQVYNWRKQLLEAADAVFVPKRKTGLDPKIEKLESFEPADEKRHRRDHGGESRSKKNALGLSDHPQLPPELQREVTALVEQTRQRSNWPARRTLEALELPRGSYYRWRKDAPWDRPRARSQAGSMYELLDSERQAILHYAIKHPEVRHRELAWRMLDEGVCGVSSSSVYRVLREADLVCRWKPRAKVKGAGRDAKPRGPDEKWQTDIKYVRVGVRNYYLVSFMDVYSRYIAHHELLACMDGLSVSTEAAAAIETLDADVRPDIQSDHGSGFIAREFAETLREASVTHKKIRPHTPTDNAEIERYHRTIGDQIDEHDLEDFTQAKAVIARIVGNYNNVRLHSALSFLRPVDYSRGDPEALLAERRRKLRTARELRKQENIKLRQRLLPWTEAETVTYPERRTVSL